MSTRRWPARHALRTRVSISATGSMTLISCPLPAGFAHAGNFPAQRKLTETDAAQLELAQRAAAAAATLAAVVAAHLELRPLLDSLDPRLLRHEFSYAAAPAAPALSTRHGMPSSLSSASAASS